MGYFNKYVALYVRQTYERVCSSRKVSKLRATRPASQCGCPQSSFTVLLPSFPCNSSTSAEPEEMVWDLKHLPDRPPDPCPRRAVGQPKMR